MIYYFPIKINKNIGSGTLSNYVCLFSDECTTIPATFWDHVVDPNGLDIRFYDSDWTTELKREIVLFDVSGHKVEAHVQIPARDVSVDKLIWCHYGGAVVANSTDIWTDSDAIDIMHCQDNSDPTFCPNSTGNSAGTVNEFGTAQADAIIHKGYYFDGSTSAQINLVDFAHSGILTVSCWVFLEGNAPSVGKEKILMMDKILLSKQSYVLAYTNTGTPGFMFGCLDGGAYHQALMPLSWAEVVNNWHHVAGVYDGADYKLFIDGVLRSSATYSIPACEGHCLVGHWPGFSGYNVLGKFDELRTYTINKSADEIATEYANQNDPDTFLTCGLENAGMIYADYSFVPDNGTGQQLFAFFNASDSFQGIISHLWDFGDGTGSSEENPSKLFGPGRHSVTLTVVGPDGTASITKEVIVYGVELSYVPDSGPVPLSVRFNSELTLP